MAKKKASAKRRAKATTKKVVSKDTVPPPRRAASFVARRGGETGVLPLGDRVLVRPLSEEELGVRTTSGIIIPETVDREKPEQGKVVAIGEGRLEDGKLIKPAVKVGDRVVFSRYGYDEVKIAGEEYYIIKSENVLAIVK